MKLTTSFITLGIGPEADEAQAKRAYKAQVRRWHPDQFPEGSAIKTGAEEQLKLINIAYARVKAHLTIHRRDPAVSASPPPPHPGQGSTARHVPPGRKSKKRSWLDHLFDALNAYTGNHAGDPLAPPDDSTNTNRRKTFEQVLDEMAGGGIPRSPRRRPANQAAAGRRVTSGCRQYGRKGGTVGSVGGSEGPGPVKPVSRVRGIGRNR